ncbi:GDSL-type esterase/lipase family protein [Zavarzinella formosa]|uniref:GDSL-type esterase/lipase family protein n=1 Tax=Zavarzinella formosa TaxID=360055 RepID=UPI00031BD8C5|nr:GDSL-type esterase/lipase family protein [Zavarzinella formosa]
MTKFRLLAGVFAFATAITLVGVAEEPKKDIKTETKQEAKTEPKDPAKKDTPKNSAIVPNERKDARSVKLHLSFVERAKKGDVQVLFLGDSITEGWGNSGKKVWASTYESMKVANFGIGGDKTQDVLWRLTEGKELEGITPKVCVLMIGTNNAASNTAEQIAEGVKADVAELRKQRPEMKILLLAVFPRASGFKEEVAPKEKQNPKIGEINKIISKLDDGKMVKYLDIGPKFLNADGGLEKAVMPDMLHLSEKGYQIWADAIKEPLADLLK